MKASGTTLTCPDCGHSWYLEEDGSLSSPDGDPVFAHMPDWYRWERDCVKEELLDGRYSLDVPVSIMMMVDTTAVYRVGTGRLQHTADGFRLTGCDGKLDYRQKPLSSYSLYADYFWYEIGDMVCIGDTRTLYYCFPDPAAGDIAAKTRLATEELYRIVKDTASRKKNG